MAAYSLFQTNILAKFLTQYAYHATRTLPILCVIVSTISYQPSKLGCQSKIHSTLRRSSS